VDDHPLNEDLSPPPAELASNPGLERESTSDLPALAKDQGSKAGRIDLSRPSWQLVLALAWPVLVQQILYLAVHLSDRLLAGRFQAVSAAEQIATQAAQTTASYLTWFIMAYTNLVTVGSTALVARFMGAGNQGEANHAANQGMLLALILGLAGSVIGLLTLDQAVGLLQLQGATASFAVSYLFPLFLFLPFLIILLAGIACLVGAGDTRIGLWVLGSIALLNLPLSWLFFHGWGPVPRLGFIGIAYGTGVSHLCGGITVFAVLLRGRAGLRLSLAEMLPNLSLIRRLLRVSVPAAADSISISCGQLWFVSIVNHLSEAAQAAHGIALAWEAPGYLSGMAVGTAAMALVGQALGARRAEVAARHGWVAFAMGGVLMVLMGGLFFALATPMFQLFCPHPSQEPIIAEGVPVLRLIAFGMPALASCLIFTASLRGAGDTRLPVLFTWLGFFAVRIPLAYFLTLPEVDLGWLGRWQGANLGLFGAWLAMIIDLQVRGVFFFARFLGGGWQRVEV
jgi:putative MATE family efflux protein